MTNPTRKLILIVVVILSIVVVSGLTILGSDSSPERDYENERVSFKVPANWSVDDGERHVDELATIRPVNAGYPNILIMGHEISGFNNETTAEKIDYIIEMYPIEEPRFEVVTRETVDVNGGKGEKLVYKSTAHDDILFVGPDYYFAVVIFKANNQNIYITTSEAMEHTFYSQVEPALDVVVNSIKVK